MQKVTLVPGDGIGPEITESVKQVLAAAGAKLEWEEMEIGLSAYEKTGELMPDSFVESMNRTKIALKGPTTTPVGWRSPLNQRSNETTIQAFRQCTSY